MRRLSIVLLSGVLSACAGLTSTPATRPDSDDGLVYFLPKKDVIFQVVVAADGKTTATVSTTEAYPDLSEAYVLKHQRSWIGTMDTKITVVNGMLATASAESTPKVSEVLQAFAKTAALPRATADVDKGCPEGINTLVIELPLGKPVPYCGFTVKVKKIGGPTGPAQATPQDRLDASYTGVYYRQQEPYRVEVARGNDLHVQQIVLSPSDAPRRRLPVAQTMFATSKADFGFVDGSPNKFDQTTHSELLALLTIPADVLKAYFGAVGELFVNFKGAQDSEVEALNAKLKLELQSKKYDACIAAIRTGNDAQATVLGCAN